jgi:hypothetical protein
MRKIPEEKKREIAIKDELETMLSDGIDDNLIFDIESIKNIPAPNTTFMDYVKVKAYSDNNADHIVNSISVFYLTADIVDEIEYIKQKITVDKITLSNLLFQMKTAEHAIIKILEDIDNGNLSPRTFEVLSALQRSKMDIVKQFQHFMVVMENNYKSLKEDYRVKKSDEPKQIEESDYGNDPNANYQMRGTRQLIETLREAVAEKRASANPNEIKINQDVK